MQFTQKSIEKIPIPKEGRTTVYDVRVPELGLRVDANGRRSFFWFKSANGQPVFRALGEYGPTLIDEARVEARKLQGLLDDWRRRDYEGENPFREPDKGITLQGLVDRYIAKRVAGHAARPEKAEAEVRWQVNYYLADWKDKQLGRVTDQDVRDLHLRLGTKNGKVTADRIVELVRRLYQWAIDKEKCWTGLNPARKGTVEYYGHMSRDRVLTAEETGKFFEALRDELNVDLKDFVWLALATEARRHDLLSMQWADIQDGVWTVPFPKGGRRRSYRVALIAEAIEVLNERRARVPQDSPSPWVFPSDSKSGHLEVMKRGWAVLLKRAGIANFRVHDLRHALPSVQVGMGVSLPVIGKGLGHRAGSPATAIYANLDLKPSNVAMAAAMTKLKADADAAIAKMKADAEAAIKAARRKTKAAKPKLLPARVAQP